MTSSVYMGSDQNTLERLLEFYRHQISTRVNLALQGKKVPYDGSELIGRESIISGDNSIYTTRDMRGQLLIGELYDKIKVIESLGRNSLECLLKTVRDPKLDDAMIWLGMNGGLQTVTREQFVRDYDVGIVGSNRTIPGYLRILSFLELISRNPELIQKLEQNSSYFPERFFAPKRKGDIESGISSQLPEIFPENLEYVIKKIQVYMNDTPLTTFSFRTIGKYVLPLMHFKLTDVPVNLEKELDALFDSREIKREVYTALMEFLSLTTSQAYSGGRTPKSLAGSKFYLSSQAFAIVINGIKDYAKNQILWGYKDSNGTLIIETPLSRFAKLKPEISDGKLKIRDGYDNSTEFLDINSSFRNTTRYLPYFTAILSRAYQHSLTLRQN